MINSTKVHQLGNSIGLFLICIFLTLAFADQFYQHTLPCPLCLLQRGCLIIIGLCLAINIKIGIKTSHYGLMNLAALLGLGISARQILLHITPNDLGYGPLFLGFHLYVWSAIIFTTIIGLIGIALLLRNGFKAPEKITSSWCTALMIFFVVLILANVISTFIECGLFMCPSNPVQYYFLN